MLVHLKLLTEKQYRKCIEVEYTHKKQSGGAGQFAKVKIIVE